METDCIAWCVTCGHFILLGPNAEQHYIDPDPRFEGATMHAGMCHTLWVTRTALHNGPQMPQFVEPGQVPA